MRRLALIAPLVMATAAAEAGPDPGFWLVGAPPGMGGRVKAVSWDGSLAVGGNGGGGLSPGFWWTAAGGRYDFGLEQGMPAGTPAFGVSSDGGVIVGRLIHANEPPDHKYRAYRYEGGILTDLGLLPNQWRSYAEGISGDGKVIVGQCENSEFTDAYGEAFRWTPQTGMLGLGFLKPNGSHSKAYGISRDGSTIVGMSQSGGLGSDKEAFAWIPVGGMKKLPDLADVLELNTEALAANADGSVIVGHSDSAAELARAVRWAAGGVQDLGVLPGDKFSRAFAVDDSGDVVGGVSYLGPTSNAVVWTPQLGMVLLSDYLAAHGIEVPADYRLTDVLAISGDGLTFAGAARNLVTNKAEGFVATIPCPSGSLVLLMALPLARRRKRG